MLRSNKSFSGLWFELKLISYSAFLTLDLLAPCNSSIGVLEISRAFTLQRSQPHYLSSLAPYWWWRHTAKAFHWEDWPQDHGSHWEALETLFLSQLKLSHSPASGVNPSKVDSAADCGHNDHYLISKEGYIYIYIFPSLK